MPAPRILTLLTAAVLLVAACSSAGANPVSPAPVASSAGAAAGGPGVVVASASSATFGLILTGPDGRTLYTHSGDSATSSTCTGACATAWPPLTTTGQPAAGPGVGGQLGTAARADGTTQVTYDGRPLYTWQGDTKAGDVTGDGIAGFSVALVGGAGQAPKASTAAPDASVPSSGKYGY